MRVRFGRYWHFMDNSKSKLKGTTRREDSSQVQISTIRFPKVIQNSENLCNFFLTKNEVRIQFQFSPDSKGLFGILIWKSCTPLVINIWTKRILPMSQKIYVVLNNLHKNGLVLDRNFERPKQLEPQVCTRTRSRPVVEVGLFLMGSLSFSNEFIYFLYSKLKRYTICNINF